MNPLEIIGAVALAAVVVLAVLWVAGVIEISCETEE